ncbi:ABC-2 transporter permease [Shouchella lehensis]|uniref:ABC-2 transporter permease n=2 Tax=Shouchella lehensis TaxID=300825 RepID=A0A060LSS2_9BACI|nr:ABC-2 transporter permease [Shouchella lehensis]AIC93055.1 hypothetical protein BleG1_0447 [Shouchella lehensis G1]MBG9783164.1 hypothetical protein [Shouchella lehensis]TES49470.1 ABC-2 transporter permease [Shouchella lehensis]
MNALLLTSYYLVYRSLFMYVGISIFVAALVLGFGQESMHPFVVLLTLLLVSIPAMEVIKHESKSGYDKFVLTMPVNRAHIVFGHYLFYLAVLAIGIVITTVTFFVYFIVVEESYMQLLVQIAPSIMLVLLIGALIFPLLYLLGPEKSDGVLIVAAGAAILVSFLMERVVSNLVFERLAFNEAETSSMVVYSLTFVLIGLILYILSFLIALSVYKRKEF